MECQKSQIEETRLDVGVSGLHENNLSQHIAETTLLQYCPSPYQRKSRTGRLTLRVSPTSIYATTSNIPTEATAGNAPHTDENMVSEHMDEELHGGDSPVPNSIGMAVLMEGLQRRRRGESASSRVRLRRRRHGVHEHLTNPIQDY